MKKTLMILGALLSLGTWGDVLGEATSAGIALDLSRPGIQLVESLPSTLEVECCPVPGTRARILVNGVVVHEASMPETVTVMSHGQIVHQTLINGVVASTDATYTIWAPEMTLNRLDAPLRELFPTVYANVTSVTILKGVTALPNGMFEGCAGLKSLVIPEGVTSIGERAFADCRSLTTVTIPASVTRVGASAFSGCTNLMRVDTPSLAAWLGLSFANSTANPLHAGGHILMAIR